MTRNIAAARFPDGSFGLRVGQPGYDVFTTPVDQQRLKFNSEWGESLRIHAKGVISSVPNDGALRFLSYADLGFIPFALFHFYDSAGKFRQAGYPVATYAADDPYGASHDFVHASAFRDGVLYGTRGHAGLSIYYTIFKLQAF